LYSLEVFYDRFHTSAWSDIFGKKRWISDHS